MNIMGLSIPKIQEAGAGRWILAEELIRDVGQMTDQSLQLKPSKVRIYRLDIQLSPLQSE